MRPLHIHFIGILIFLVAASVSPTWAYFYDAESSSGNIFVATLLDGEVEGGGFEADICELGEETTAEFNFKNIGVLPFLYDIHVPEISEDSVPICDVLDFTIMHNGSLLYMGPIDNFTATDLPLLPGDADTWTITAEFQNGLGFDAVDDKQCDFETVFTAKQQGFLEGQAFYDVETLAHSIVGFAPDPNQTGGDITIEINNEAEVENNIETEANTGGNTTTGGDAEGEGGEHNESPPAGGAGNATTTTGDASASTTVVNHVNETTIEITGDSCGCGGGDVTVTTTNTASTTNSVTTSTPEHTDREKRERR